MFLVTRQKNLLSECFETSVKWLQPFLNIDIKQAFYIVVEQIIKNDNSHIFVAERTKGSTCLHSGVFLYKLTLSFHLFVLHNELVQHLMGHMSDEPVED